MFVWDYNIEAETLPALMRKMDCTFAVNHDKATSSIYRTMADLMEFEAIAHEGYVAVVIGNHYVMRHVGNYKPEVLTSVFEYHANGNWSEDSVAYLFEWRLTGWRCRICPNGF